MDSTRSAEDFWVVEFNRSHHFGGVVVAILRRPSADWLIRVIVSKDFFAQGALINEDAFTNQSFSSSNFRDWNPKNRWRDFVHE